MVRVAAPSYFSEKIEYSPGWVCAYTAGPISIDSDANVVRFSKDLTLIDSPDPRLQVTNCIVYCGFSVDSWSGATDVTGRVRIGTTTVLEEMWIGSPPFFDEWAWNGSPPADKPGTYTFDFYAFTNSGTAQISAVDIYFMVGGLGLGVWKDALTFSNLSGLGMFDFCLVPLISAIDASHYARARLVLEETEFGSWPFETLPQLMAPFTFDDPAMSFKEIWLSTVAGEKSINRSLCVLEPSKQVILSLGNCPSDVKYPLCVLKAMAFLYR